jgi:translocation and assembly module TamA
MGAYNRLIVRGEAGGTFTNALVDMPPSLRFFAGGDRSIRGYAFREVGPTTIGSDGKKYALGAKNVLTGSVEFEHYFNDTWGAAGFVDAGDAFDDTPDIHTGVGFGARWKSPVGPVRFDIAHGLNDPDSDYEIYLNIGADW